MNVCTDIAIECNHLLEERAMGLGQKFQDVLYIFPNARALLFGNNAVNLQTEGLSRLFIDKSVTKLFDSRILNFCTWTLLRIAILTWYVVANIFILPVTVSLFMLACLCGDLNMTLGDIKSGWRQGREFASDGTVMEWFKQAEAIRL